MFKMAMIVWAVIIAAIALKLAGVAMGPAIIWLTFLAAYFLPIVVAIGRKHRNTLAIFILNLFLGWTGLGWIFALVWSCTNGQA
jgi:hypothetical protein